MMKRPWKTGSAARPQSGVSTNGGGRLNKPSPQSIRGRISNPMPIASPTDDEFPMRQPDTGIAAGPGEEPPRDTRAVQGQPTAEEEEGTLVAEPVEPVGAPPGTDHTEPEESQQTTEEPQPHPAPIKTPENQPPASTHVRHSVISEDTARTKSSKGRNDKKKSGLRGALGKLFGRRKKTNSVGGTTGMDMTPQDHERSNHHHSDPNNLRRASSKVDAKRSVSLPVTEYDRALGSHSVGPDDVFAIDSVRNSLAADGLLTRRRPGAASTHLIGVRTMTGAEWGGLTPRPASSHGIRDAQRDGGVGDEKQDPAEIGRAITSDAVGLKRRSRSLSFLAGLPQDPDGGVRRSHELRFWRQSFEPNLASPVSTNAEDADAGPLAMDTDTTQAEQATPGTPPQPFTFGDIAAMNEMAGMRITEAVSMDSRIGSLEARMQRMEDVVTQLCSTMPNFKPRLEEYRPATGLRDAASGGHTFSMAPLNMSTYQASGREMRTPTRPSTQQSQMSRTSFGDTQTFVDPGSRTTASFTRGAGLKTMADRPISEATIRGAASLPHLSRDTSKTFTIDHYTTLMALIDTERSARQALEAQVKVLGHQVSILSKATRKRHGHTNSTASGIQRSAFDVDEDEDEGLRAALSPVSCARPGARGHHDDDDDDDDDSEIFATPHEEGRNMEAQLEEVEVEEDKRRRTERTLSLSRLTLGSGMR